MARGVNKVILLGNLGIDPEVRHTQSGMAVVNLNLATNTPVKRDGEWLEETEWHRIVAWGRLAEICGEYLVKGSRIYTEGKLRTRSWEDEDGNKQYVTEVVAREIQIISGNKDKEVHHAEDVPPLPSEDEDMPF
jgi:single-strand DNA-binding protein